MAEYHVSCSVLASGIYGGTLNKKGDKWKYKTDVTKEALDAVAFYLLMNKKELRFTDQDKRYALRIVEIEGEANA